MFFFVHHFLFFFVYFLFFFFFFFNDTATTEIYTLSLHDALPIRQRVPVARFPGLTPVGLVARRLWRGAVLWGGVFALMVWALVSQFAKEYPTAADRARLVETMGADVGSQAIFGPAHHLDTVAGYTAYHAVGVLGLVVAVWGLLAATRLLRGEEQAGRWELLLAGQTTRRRATAAAIGGLGIGLLTLWAVTAAAAPRGSRPMPRPPMAAAVARRLVVWPASSSSQRPACSSPRSRRVAANRPHTATTRPSTPTAW